MKKNKEPAKTISKAAPLLEKAAAAAGKDKTVWLEIAKVYGKLGSTDKELDAYKKYLEADPQNVDANVRIGMILMDRNKTTDAMVYLETANMLSPNNPDVQTKLAAAYVKTNRPKDALNLLQKVKTSRPDDMDLRKNLLDSYTKLGMVTEAVGEAKDLVEKTKAGDIEVCNGFRKTYASFLIKAGKFDDANSVIEDIKASNPEDLEALQIQANICMTKKDYTKAQEVYKEMSYIDPNYVPMLCGRGDAFLGLNKPLQAREYYQRAIRGDEKYALGYLGLGKVCKVYKDNDGWTTNVKKAYALDPNEPVIQLEYQLLK